MIARTISSAMFLIITILFTAAGADRLQAQTAQADRAETSHIASSLPAILSPQDIELYQQIFALQEAGEIKKAAKRIEGLENKILLGHLLSQKYLHPTAWRSSYTELKDWLNHYSDHPAASRIKWLADKRRPKGAKYPKPPKKGYLNGVGQSRPQSFRALIPQSYKGRASPRQTARIAREIRRYIRRGHPSGALEYLNQKKTLRYLTKTEEGHLRGEIAHAYFIFGVDDKAIRQARYAIAKGGEKAWMGMWAGGLAAWRSKQFELAHSFFHTLADTPNAPDMLVAGAAFWTYRSAMRVSDPATAMQYLNVAAQHHDSFYGVLALHATGQIKSLDFSLPAYDKAFIPWLTKSRGGRRTIALLEIGNWTEAERELRYLHEECPQYLKPSMITFAAHNHMPSLAFRLADLHQRNTGKAFYGALYPMLDPIFDYQIDEALVHAIIRKESGFYPLARSRAKAAGLMQLMPATAAFISQERRYRTSWRHRLHNPHLNLKLGQDYIQHLLKEPVVDGNLVKMLAAYNGGPGNLNKWMRKINHDDDLFTLLESLPARETRNYVKGVISYLYMYRMRLDKPLPELEQLVDAGADKADLAFLLSPARGRENHVQTR